MPPTRKPLVARKPSKTKSRGHARKEKLVGDVRGLVDEYAYAYVFDVVNARSALLKDARVALKSEARFVFGKMSVVRVALGRTPGEAYMDGLDHVASLVRGNTAGLMFTNLAPEEAEARVAQFRSFDFARTGNVAPRTVRVEAGPLAEQPSSMLEQLRGMGVPVVLKKGVVHVERDFNACEEGRKLTSQQARALKAFGVKLAEFRVRLLHRWTKETGDVARLADAGEADAEGGAAAAGASSGEDDEEVDMEEGDE